MNFWLKKMFDPDLGNKTPLRDFPGLYFTELQTGFWGIIFLLSWWYGVNLAFEKDLSAPQGENFRFWVYLTAGTFFFLMFLSAAGGWFFNDASRYGVTAYQEYGNQYWGRIARIGIAILSGSYVLACGFLLYLTGGPRSPFAPFFVMIFSLTLKKMRFPFPGWRVFVYFAVILLAACVLNYSNPPSSQGVMTKVLPTDFHTSWAGAFLLLSLFVPTISSHVSDWLSEKQKKRDLPSSPTFNPTEAS